MGSEIDRLRDIVRETVGRRVTYIERKTDGGRRGSKKDKERE